MSVNDYLTKLDEAVIAVLQQTTKGQSCTAEFVRDAVDLVFQDERWEKSSETEKFYQIKESLMRLIRTHWVLEDGMKLTGGAKKDDAEDSSFKRKRVQFYKINYTKVMEQYRK